MARPSGTVAPSDFGYWANQTDAEYMYVIFPITFMPPHWQDTIKYADNAKLHNVHKENQITTANATADLYVSYWENGTSKMFSDEYVGTAYTGEWLTTDADVFKKVAGRAYVAGADYGSNQATDYPRFAVVQLDIFKDTADDAQLDTVYFEMQCESQHDDDATALLAEKITRTTEAKRLYKKYRSQSSYLMMEGVTHTVNNIGYEARWAMSCPMFKTPVPA